MKSAPKIESWTQIYQHLYSNMDAHELMLRRSQYICLLSLVNARFSILERQNPTKNAILFFFPFWTRRSRQQSLTCFRETPCLFVIGIGNERNPSPTSPTEFSFVGNDRRPSQISETRRENRNAPDSPDLTPSIPDSGISTISSFH